MSHRPQPNEAPFDRLNALIEALRATPPHMVSQEQLHEIITLADQLALTPFEQGVVNRAVLLPQIFLAGQENVSNTRTYGQLLELCTLFEATPSSNLSSPDERCFIHLMSARAKMLASLDSTLTVIDQANALAEAEKRLVAAETLLSRYTIEGLGPQIELLRAAIEGAKTHTFTTILRFDLPFAIAVPDGKYTIALRDGGRAEFEIVFQPPSADRFGFIWDSSGALFNVEVNSPDSLPDPIGPEMLRVQSLVSSRAPLGFSAIRIELPYLIDSYGELPLPEALNPPSSEPISPLVLYQFPEEFRHAVELTNHFIDHVRAASGRYEIDRITAADVEAVSMVTMSGGVRVMVLPLRGSGPYRVTRGDISPPEWLMRLEANLLTNSTFDTVTRLILDARKYILQRELRLAVLNTNAAFELFVNTHYNERVNGFQASSPLDEFMLGESIFESCRRELVDRGRKRNSVSLLNAAELLPTPPVHQDQRHRPSVFQIVKRMDSALSFGFGKSKLNKLVNTIRYARNDVAHGTSADIDLDPDRVHRSLEALSEFITAAQSTLDSLRTPLT